MADYVFPDTESLEIPHILSERTSMHQPHLDADRQLLQAALFLDEKPNNVVYSVHAKTKAPVIAEILKNHPLFVPLTKEAAVPLIYVQQAWKLLEFHETEDRCYYTTKVDHFTINFGLNKFRHLLGFPSATSRPGAVQFEPFDSVDEAIASVHSIGYNAELNTTSGFNKTNLPPTYNTLFTILNRCLTGKKTAHDTATQSMFLLFQGVLFNRHYDYAALIFHDMHELKGRNPNHFAYPRFLSILIASAMEQNPEIPRRLNSVKVKHFSFQSVRYPPTVFGPEIPLFSELLAYADQGVKCVREYRAKYASMVQPEPAGPSQDAIHRGEGIVLRDQRSRDPGQGEQRENTERGLGGDLPDQPAHSSTANVAAHIGQISSAVQMDDVFAAAEDEHAVNQPFIEQHDDEQLVDYALSPLDMDVLESFGEHEVEPLQAQLVQHVPLYTPVEMDQRLTILMGYESSGSVSSEETLILPSDSEAACDMDAQTEELHHSDDDDSDDDADMPDQGSSRLLTLGEIRTDEGVLVENPEVRMSEREGEKDGESEIGARKEVQTPPQAESSWVATSTRGEHLLPSPIDQDMRSPLMQCTTQLNHSTVSQQMVVSTSHGDLSQLVPIPHLEVGGTDIVRQLPPPTTSFPSTSSLEPIAINVNLPLSRTPVQTTFAGGFSSPAGTTGVSSAFVAGLRGPEGNPISANIMPTLNMGSLGSTFGSTRSLSDLGVSLPVSPIITALRQQSTILGSSSTPVGSSSSASSSATQSSTVSASSASDAPSSSAPPQTGTTSSPDVDLSRMPVVITANQLITRSLFRANNEQMATVIKQQTERISALEKQVAALAKGKAPMPDPPAQPTQSAADSLSIPELKGLLFSKLLEAGSSEDSDLVGILQQQTALQQRAIQEQRSQSHLVTHTEFQQFQASLDASLTKTFTEINKMFTEGLSQLSDRIRGVEETCQAAARRPTRRHDDHDDHDRHEGERKRRRLESEPSRAPTTSGVRIVDRFEERPPREKQPARHRDSIVLAGGEEMETEEPVMQSTLDFLNSIQEEMPEERVEESGVKFSGASSSLSEIDRVLALLDNVASELRDYQVPNEEINDARCAEDIRLKDMFDDVEFDFEKEKPVDDVEGPSLEEVLPQDDLMPVDPKKVELWEKMKASSGKFLKRTEWDRFTRATGKYLEERYKSRFCYHERKLSYTKLYGIENLKKELRTEYIHMRRVNRQRREMLVSDHKFVSVTSYKTSKLSTYLYPVITFRRDDGKEYTITEADFQDLSFDVILGILYDLKGKSFRTEEEIIALTAIVRHVKVSISLAHLYDFQLGLENWTSKLFCHKPRRNLIGDEKDFVMYTVFYDAEETEISCVYPDSMGNKKRMYSHEVMLYCDDTLKMVMDNLNLRLQMDSHNVHDISAANKVLIRHFVSEIDRRLRLRVDIRFAEIKFKLRKPSDQTVVDADLQRGSSKESPQEIITISEPTVDDVTKKGVDQGVPCKPTITKDLNKEKNVVPPKLPIRGILKNPNRFSALATDSSNGGRGENLVLQNISQMFNIACWNIRGLNAFDKQQEVRSLIRNNNLSICTVLESHVRVESLRTVCASSFGRWDWVSNQAVSEYGTRIIIAWDVSNVDVMVLESHRQYMHCEVRIRGLMHGFFVSFVYGDNRGSERRSLWTGLRRFKAIMGDKPWLIAGDFNCLLFPHDAFGGISRRNSDMADFASCLEDVDVFDIRRGIKRKLDRILANTFFTSLFDDATARFLPRGLSDHSPGIVGFTGGTRARKASFKFDNFLVNDPQFLPMVERFWNEPCEGTFMFRLTSKLKSLKTPLRKLRSTYGNLSAKTIELKEELDVAQLSADIDPGNVILAQEVKRIREAYQKSCWVDFSASRQRAKVKWLAEGDANTRYFHRVIEERRHSRHIHSVCNAAGVYVFDDDVAMAFIDHFVAIIGTNDTQVMPVMPDSLFHNRLSLGNATHMIRPIQDSEIRDALFSIGNDKAPGSDGFSSKLFKAAWEILGSDVLVAIHNFFYRGHLAKELNHTLLCLLPKSPNATSVSDFRPIACCSVLYKCISKVLVSRLKPYLDGLINKAQSAFIPGRKIGDNILMAHELVSGYHLERGPPRCAFKIDLRKAYDMVSWEYLFGMLKGFGFHPTFIKWITEMVSTPSFSIVVNGESRGFFQGKRGIRQGDPLSPYLFTLVMEGFSMLFKQCIEEAADFGYHNGCDEFGITHLCFADDLFVFTRGDVHSVEVLKKTLSLFAVRSGLSPNLQKSDVFFGNVGHDVKEAILHCLPFRSGTFPIRYLGVPLSPVALKTADYGVLVTKVKGRIQNWKSKFLSFGGRKQLICSVLQSLQLYWMAIFLLPSGVVHEIESLFRDFLWAQGDSSKGRCKVAWAMVCRPKECGGLGFRRLATWNRALVVKNIWSLVTNRDCLWVSWIRNHALRNMGLWTARKNTRWSWVLTKMMGIREDIRRFVTVRIGDGQTTNAWEDAWLPCGPLAEFVPHRFIHAHSFNVATSVKQLMDTFHDGWPDYWVTRFPNLANMNLPILQNDVQDVCSWNIDANGNGNFSVQRVYQALEGEQPLVPWWRSVWFKAHIPKHSFCLWTACLNRLPTQDRIAAWKDEPPDMRCSLCGITRDSHNHLFFECSFSRQIWLQVMDKVHWVDFPCSWNGIVDALSDNSTAPKLLEHKLALAASVYVVWCERNRRLFVGDSKPIPHLVRMILDSVLERVAWKQRKSSVRPNDVATD
ncbi:hypothetical protein OSB04_un000281 [Centaurea solstitialis]|uniref:Reverse transcriptase domain-containing protein n=1 Tax=Centaurea solstitialis TaxID=347529 RepID=A0AA38S6I2_9ASTR|nr:hypothetical protein OSB04_un000281 [Centaurea solstitialis]